MIRTTLGESSRELKEELVSFRKLVSEIPSTTYASHGMYYYPAKFIPQVVRYAIEKYTEEGDWLIDPFAGSGTVGIEALITNRNALLLDLSPMLEVLMKTKTTRNVRWDSLRKKADRILTSTKPFHPSWTRTRNWHPPEFYAVLSKMWSAYHENPDPLLLIALLKTTKRFSFADDQVPKLFKSKHKIKEVQEMLNSDFRKAIPEYFLNALEDVYEKSVAFSKLYKGGEIKAVGNVDLLNYNFDGKFQLLITSPPYGQAHEYIRSVKLELAWLNYSDKEITNLNKLEIPYNKVPETRINSETYHEYLPKISGSAIKFYEIYFKSILACLSKVGKHVVKNGYACIFVGNATFSGVKIPFAKIFEEHLAKEGFEYEALLEDKIKARRLFTGRNNLSPNGMSHEYLLVLKKTN